MKKSGALSGNLQDTTVNELVSEITGTFVTAGIEHAKTEARDVVAAICNERRFWPVVNGSETVTAVVVELSRAAAQRRAAGAPFAYAVGRAAFRHLTLKVNSHVLIPRQETEQLVELVLNALSDANPGVIVDVGTGTGAIALSLATELLLRSNVRERNHPGNDWKIIATDVSSSALSVARENAETQLNSEAIPVEFRSGDMFSVISERGIRAIVSNPPYIAYEEMHELPTSVRNWEPPEALYSSRQGMRAIERLVKGSAQRIASGGLLALEVDSRRASLVAELMLSHGDYCDVRVEFDLSGRERFALATRK